MKRITLLLMLTLGFLGCICAQTPKILDNGYLSVRCQHPAMVKSIKLNDKKTYTPRRENKASEDSNVSNVNFQLTFDSESEIAYEIRVFNEDRHISNWDQRLYSLNLGSNILSIPNGIYDIIVTFQRPDQETGETLCENRVIRERVNIAQDTTLEFAADEAKNHIHLETLTIDGVPAYTGKYTLNDNWEYVLQEQGNCDYVEYMKCLYCEDYGTLEIYQGFFGLQTIGEYQILGHESNADVFVNDVSGRWTFWSQRYIVKGHEVYSSAYEVQGANSDVTITNDPSKYNLFEDPFNVKNSQNNDLYQTYSWTKLEPKEGVASLFFESYIMSPISEGESCKYYVSASVEDSKVGYVPIIQPQISHLDVTEDGINSETIGCSLPLTNMNDETVLVNNGTGTYLGYNIPNYVTFFNNDLGNIEDFPNSWPSHPNFSYSVDKKRDVLFNNCPLLVASPYQQKISYSWNNQAYTYCFMFYDFAYLGRYGEKVIKDISNAQLDIKVEGEGFYSGIALPIELDDLLSGVIDATINNETFIIDDLTGSNKVQLHYTASAEDETPPTMTMLHFRNCDSDVTDRFANGDDGTLEFSAGDFNCKFFQDYMYYDRFAPESVEVSYSPYGEDNWNELEVEEVPEYYWPAMGWFYTAPLTSVTGEAYQGWFDLKIRLEDAAGNWQEQVISPAFRIDNLAYSSVATVGSDNAREVARYNLAGQRVDADATGIVIIKMSDGTARKVLVK